MSQDNETILDKIKRLYTELFLEALSDRIGRYHAFHHEGHTEFSDMLHELIDEMVRDVSASSSVVDYKEVKFLDSEILEASGKLEYMQFPTKQPEPGSTSELAEYLKKKVADENEMHLAVRLRKSVWEHVHSAHRLARSGNGDNAKLHADLAVSAMRTLSHYLSADEFTSFLDKVRTELNVMVPGVADKL